MKSFDAMYGIDEAINSLLLEMAQQRSMDRLFQLVTTRLAEFPTVALARIWLIKPGDVCQTCNMMAECYDQETCLHLVASAGRSICDLEADWTRLDGEHRRFPMGARKVGHIASTGKPVVVENMEQDTKWIAYRDWARKEEILGFAGQPLVFRGEVLGVLAIFTHVTLNHSILYNLRLIADHTASALANALAFDEIEQLRKKLELENTYLRDELLEVASLGGIVGKSAVLQKVLNQVELVAPTNASVLVLGESGTGKELVAREIHHRSLRHNKTMIKVNCASFPRELFASEFFGHAKGSFTGAMTAREGRFSAADGSTLFLDEVGEIPLELQSKLLRVLQEGEYERVGENLTRKVDVRIIAATNRDLKHEVKAGRFREDLYFRLNVFPIEVPPLRARREDIGLLADHFLQLSTRKMNRTDLKLTVGQIAELQQYDWPGNVRELHNLIERAVIATRSGTLKLELPKNAEGVQEAIGKAAGPADTKQGVLTEAEMVKLQRANTLAALQQCDWKIYGEGGAAEILGIKPTTLTTRMKTMGLSRPLNITR
ncbi:sigma 54-interacting transcriptional regulator [Geomonas subterranea]|uniref:Sigma 54-interacting transcriptional regulator n=1 Tax=Geomonas subterranea TaxID=2847989 RepID=A0ABX8LKV6_9BACT|nr:sigma 54-interacting transcriptional regulator [Geomonas subterranea]QXE92660.1 sigma 54-interacting transcriptional regulator [Geomonas subterranea]QXM09241.1 sigma 54-interacting transcriptional regulator [Geomonas subterranea]